MLKAYNATIFFPVLRSQLLAAKPALGFILRGMNLFDRLHQKLTAQKLSSLLFLFRGRSFRLIDAGTCRASRSLVISNFWLRHRRPNFRSEYQRGISSFLIVQLRVASGKQMIERLRDSKLPEPIPAAALVATGSLVWGDLGFSTPSLALH